MRKRKTIRRGFALFVSLVMLFGMTFSGVPTFAEGTGEGNGELNDVLVTQNPQEDGDENGGSAKSVIDEPDIPPTHTYTFYLYSGDENAWGDSQIVRDGEHLVEPEAPEVNGQKFVGWFVGDEEVLFGESNPITVEETAAFEAVAKFVPVYYVFFMDGTGENARVFRTKEGESDSSIDTTDVELPIGSTQAVTGWYENKSLDAGDPPVAPVGDSYTIGTANQQLWPKIEEGKYIYFVTGPGATCVEPQFVLPGANTQVPTTSPTRPGYTFSYWSTSPDGSAYTFGGVLLEDTTLYAVWAPEEDTAYTVVFWKQSVNDDKTWTDEAKTYDYAESLVRYAETGSTVWPTDADGEKNYQGFHYNDLKSTEVEVNGDGTTILNVYYDRNPLTIDFRIDTPAVLDYNDTYTVSKPWSWPHPSPPAAVEGYQWYDTTRAGGNFSDFIFHYAKIVTPASDGFQFTGLYGQTLAQNGYTWPSENRWRQNKNGGNTLTFLDSFIFDDLLEYGNSTYITVYGQAPSTGAQIIHYKEALDGTWVTANTIQTKGGTFYFSNKYTGFTVAYYSADSGSWKSVRSRRIMFAT